MNALYQLSGLRRTVMIIAILAVAAFGLVVVQAEPADAVSRSGYRTCTPEGRAVRVSSNAKFNVTHYYRGENVGTFFNGQYQTRNGYGTSSGGSDFWRVNADNGILSASATCATT